MNKYTIVHLKLTAKSKRKRERTLKDLMSRVFSDTCKEDLIAYLTTELKKKSIKLDSIRLRDVTPR